MVDNVERACLYALEAAMDRGGEYGSEDWTTLFTFCRRVYNMMLGFILDNLLPQKHQRLPRKTENANDVITCSACAAAREKAANATSPKAMRLALRA